MPNLKLYYHLCKLGHNPDAIFGEQLNYLIDSGLLEKLSEIHFVFISNPIANNHDAMAVKTDIGKFIAKRTKVQPLIFLHVVKVPEKREQITLELLYQDAKKHPGDYYLYIHSKGLSYPIGSHVRNCVDNWRRLMCEHLILNYENALSALEGCDAVGINLTTTETDGRGNVPRHFSGNYWWAKGSYVQTLSNPSEFPHLDIREPEFWIGSGTGELKTLFQSNKNHYVEL